MMKKHLGFIFNLIAIGLFIPGIILPMFSLDMEVIAQVSGASINSEIVNKELSLIQTIEELMNDNRVLVAILIFVFSICIPVLKALLVFVAYIKKHTQLERRILNFVAAIGKWSMADVFVVAVFLAILSTNHAETASQEQISIIGFKIDLFISSETLSAVGEGFYYFTAYCVLSLLGTHLSHSSLPPKHAV